MSLTNEDVVRAFVNGSRESARNSNGTISFRDLYTLYSNEEPIAWRSRKGILYITKDASSVTTSHHISLVKKFCTLYTAINHVVDTSKLDTLGVDRRDILESYARVELSDSDLFEFLKFSKQGSVFSLLKMNEENLGRLANIPVKTSEEWYLCFKGDSILVNPVNLFRYMVPKEHRSMIDKGWVQYIDGLFFVGQPEIKTRSIPGKTRKNVSEGLLKEYGLSVTESRNGLVRGTVRSGEFVSGRITETLRRGSGGKLYWYLPVKPSADLFHRGLSRKVLDDALSEGDVRNLLKDLRGGI